MTTLAITPRPSIDRPEPVEDAPTILVAENDPALLAATRVRLEFAGYRCVTVETGQAALSAFAAGDIDIVVTDLAMPGGDGVQLARHLRAISHVPIIIVTGLRMEHRAALREMRDVTVLRKPVSSSDLLDEIETHLSISGARLA